MKRILFALIMICLTYTLSVSQNGWTQLDGYPGSGSTGMVGIGYSGSGFAGQGFYGVSSSNFADWWQYVPASNTWTARTSLPASSRYSHNGFTIGENAYICLGSDWTNYFNDLWQYNITTGSWTQKANFPGTSRYGAIAQAAGTKAYVGLGQHPAGGGILDYFTDFYAYDAGTNTWASKAAFPGQGRYFAFSFTIGNIIYVVGGRSEVGASWVYLKEMWAYDITADSWTQKTSYPGSGSFGLGGFALGQYAYVGMGYSTTSAYRDFWQYDPLTDTWTQLPDFPGQARYCFMNFNLGNTGYLGCGQTSTGAGLGDFWKYDAPAGLSEDQAEQQIQVFPLPAGNYLYFQGTGIHFIELFTSNGSLVKHENLNIPQKNVRMDISDLTSGFYYARIGFGKKVVAKKIIVN